MTIDCQNHPTFVEYGKNILSFTGSAEAWQICYELAKKSLSISNKVGLELASGLFGALGSGVCTGVIELITHAVTALTQTKNIATTHNNLEEALQEAINSTAIRTALLSTSKDVSIAFVNGSLWSLWYIFYESLFGTTLLGNFATITSITVTTGIATYSLKKILSSNSPPTITTACADGAFTAASLLDSDFTGHIDVRTYEGILVAVGVSVMFTEALRFTMTNISKSDNDLNHENSTSPQASRSYKVKDFFWKCLGFNTSNSFSHASSSNSLLQEEQMNYGTGDAQPSPISHGRHSPV